MDKRCNNCIYHQDKVNDPGWVFCNLRHFKAWAMSVACRYWEEYFEPF